MQIGATDEFVVIPRTVIESEAYLSLPYSCKVLLIELYADRGDCETFTVDIRAKRYPDRIVAKNINRLVASGLLALCGTKAGGNGQAPRVFAFVHKLRETQ